MKNVCLRFAVLVLGGACLMTATGWSQTSNEPLGDVAKETRNESGKPAKVFTNDDMGSSSSASDSSSAPSSSATATTDAASDAKDKAASDADAAKPAADKDAKPDPEEAKNKLELLKKDQSSTKGLIAHVKQMIENEPDESRKENYRSVLQHANEHMKDLDSQVSDAEKAAAAAPAAPAANPPKADDQQTQQ